MSKRKADLKRYCEAVRQQGGVARAVKVKKIPFDERSVLKCFYGCSEHGKKYHCPEKEDLPFFFRRIELLKKYRWAIILGSTDRKQTQEMSLEIEKMCFYDGHYWAMSFADCSLCQTCGKGEGRACPHPEKSRPGFHTIGVDVFRTCKKWDLPLTVLTATTPQPNWYAVVFVE